MGNEKPAQARDSSKIQDSREIVKLGYTKRSMQRKTIAIISICVVGIAAGAAYLTLRPTTVTAPTSAPLALPEQGYTEHGAYYDITADYATSTPLLASAGALADASARSTMLSFIRDTVHTFKTEGNFDHLTASDIKTMGFDQGRKETLQITYTTASSPHTLSYIFTIYEDTLGAHGNTFFKTFTFDTKSGALLPLGDLFIPSSSYLSTLSVISRTKLPALIGQGADTAMIKIGTEPTADNFANFYLDGSNLVLLFPPYAVAPYAAGPQTLRIPLSQLSSTLKAAYH